MNLNDQYAFLARRQDFETKYFNSIEKSEIVKSISVVDVNTTELCNRTCVFCPRHDPEVFPNRNLRMTADGAKIISSKLGEINYTGTIAISGFGENLLNPEIEEIINAFRSFNPNAFIECNTNGDPLSRKLANSLFNSGLDCLNINLYDGPEQVEKFNTILKGIDESKIKYRAHWKTEDYGIIFNNRSGLVKWYKRDELKDVGKMPCYYPFYKLFVDWNGDVLFCANDWGREIVVGNLLQQTVYDVWMSKEMRKVRERLADGDRSRKPCNTCSVNGTLLGKQSFDMLVKHYEKNSYNG